MNGPFDRSRPPGNTSPKTVFLAVLGLFFIAGAVLGAPGAGPDGLPPTRVLFIGNSYTYYNDLPDILAALAGAGGRPLEVKMVAPGGWRLKDQWEKGEALPTLHGAHWNFVVLQDQSTLGVGLYIDGKTRVDGDAVFRPYALKWAQAIVRDGAVPVFYLTWARQASPEDQDRLSYAYMTAARASLAKVAPVGLAWQRVREQRPEIELFQPDGSHPSPAGSYLAACAIYAVIFGRSPEGLPGRVRGRPVNLDTERVEDDKDAILVDLQPEEARLLQSAAWTAWQEISEHGGYLSFPEPEPAMLAPPPEGIRLSAVDLEGSWEGELIFHPSGPIRMTMLVRRVGDGWAARLTLDYRAPDIADESVDIEAFAVDEKTITFVFPRSAATAGLDIRFRGVATGRDELLGTAEASRPSADAPLRLLGSWHALRLQNSPKGQHHEKTCLSFDAP